MSKESDARYQREARKRNPEKFASYDRKKHYGLSHEDYLKLVVEQEGVCKICGNPPVRAHLDVDHGHETGKVRGLLCNSCNGGLGLFRDSQDLLRKAINYLEEA